MLAAIIAPAVSGSKEAGIDAQVVQDAMQVRRAASAFFSDQSASETRKFHTVTTTTKLPTAGGLAAEDGDPKRVVTAKQGISSRWPEKFVTSGTTSFDSLAKYSDVVQTSADPVADTVILLDGDNKTISGRTFLEQMSALDIDTLVTKDFLSEAPKGFDRTSNGFPNFLWLLDKSTSNPANPDDSREVAVFKLLKVDKIEGQKTAGGTQKVKLTYRQIFGGASETIPIANPQSVTTKEDVDVNIVLTGSDPEGDTITFAIVDQPTIGTLVALNAATGALTYTPNANVHGSDSFTFKTNDGKSDSSKA
ncbi:MAG: Ig-like domain-containing protein, partial [Chloroflexi bacterium]|nr:Ig-like domain-containing protein [Chloroflexota bacterium]